MKIGFRAWFLLIPAMVLLVFTGLVPFFYALYIALNRYILVSATAPMKYIGLNNFRTLVNDIEFTSSFLRGVAFSAACVLVQLWLGLGVAFILFRGFKGISLFRVILCLPLAIPPIAIGSMWKLMMNPGIGPVPYLLRKVGILYDYTGNAFQAFVTTILMDTWHWTPFVALVLLAGLSAIPRETIESAEVDGASPWQMLRYVYLPLIKHECLLVILLRFMDAFRIFDEVWMLTTGGPGSATRYLSISLYTLILKGWDMGYGAAISLVFLYVIIVLSWILFKVITVKR